MSRGDLILRTHRRSRSVRRGGGMEGLALGLIYVLALAGVAWERWKSRGKWSVRLDRETKAYAERARRAA